MMKVVVTFTNGAQRSDEMIPRSVFVVERRISEVMRERVDTKRGLMDKKQSEKTSIDVTTLPVTPPQASDNGGEDVAHENDKLEVMAVLPPDNLVLGQVANVGDTGIATRLENHPADVRPEKTPVCAVRIEVGVGIPMVGAMSARPPPDRALNGTRTKNGKEILQRLRCVIGTMSPESVVSCGNANCGHEVVDGGPDRRLPAQADCERANDAQEWGEPENSKVEQVKFLVPVAPSDGREGCLAAELVRDIVVRKAGVCGLFLSVGLRTGYFGYDGGGDGIDRGRAVR